jgi:hypothetical protein
MYIWPEPNMETERWRYVNVKECRAALRRPVPSEFDPRGPLKKGFKESLDALREEIYSSLQSIVEMDQNGRKIVDKMTLKATTMWLEFGVQRCRILIINGGSNTRVPEEMIEKAKANDLTLTVVPTLKRWGNSKGLELNIEETIGDCDGETISLPA